MAKLPDRQGALSEIQARFAKQRKREILYFAICIPSFFFVLYLVLNKGAMMRLPAWIIGAAFLLTFAPLFLISLQNQCPACGGDFGRPGEYCLSCGGPVQQSFFASWKCDTCSQGYASIVRYPGPLNYCPNCGVHLSD